MALWKKKGEGSGPADAQEGAEAPAAGRRRRPNETLSSVVKESAPGSAVDLLVQNTAFELPNRAGWVILLLPTADPAFGGLSAKQSGNSDKGSIVEQITADHIQVLVTARMLDEDVLGIIPTAQTVDRMGEFGILRSAPYFWGVVRVEDDGSLAVDIVETATYDQAAAVARGGLELAEALPAVWAWAGGGEAGSAAEEPLAPPAHAAASADPADEAPVDWEDTSETPFSGGGADEPELEVQTPAPLTEEDLEVDYGALDAESGNEDEGDDWMYGDDEDAQAAPEGGANDDYLQYVDENRSRVVTEEEVRSSIVRRFAPEDVDVRVDMAVFDATFTTEAPVIREPEGGRGEWLGEQVADLVSQANAQLAQLHESNHAALRQQYVELASLHAEKVVKDASLSTPGAEYEKLASAAKADYDEDLASANEEVSRRRQEIVKRFETEAEEAGAAAAAAAKARHQAQNKLTLERVLSEVAIDVERKAEDRYAAAQSTLLDLRRRESAMLYDLGVTRTVQLLTERQFEQREAEAALLKDWNERIVAFIDENRKSDVARINALAEQQARHDQVKALTEQYAAERDALLREQSAKVSDLEAEISAVRAKAVDDLRARDEAWGHKVAVEEGRTAQANELISALTSQMGQLNDKIEGQYKGRIADLEADKASYSEELERAAVLQKRANHIMIVLIVVLTLAALAVGVIIGWALLGAGVVTATASPASLLTAAWPLAGV